MKLLVFTLFFSFSSFSKTLDKVVASVNSRPILFSELSHFKKTLGLRAQLDPFFSESSLSTQSTDAQVLEYLINESLVLSEFPVSDAEVDQEINTIQSNNKVNRAGLTAAIQQQGYRFNDYFELIRIGTAKRNLIDREIRSKMSISDEDVKNYYLSNRTNSPTLLSHVYLWGFKSKSSADLVLKQIKQGTLSKDNVSSKLFSSDLTPNNGDLGFLKNSQMSSFVKKAVNNLKQGQVSSVITKQKNAHYLIYLKEQKSESFNIDDPSFAREADSIRSKLSADEFRKQLTLWMTKQRDVQSIYRVNLL